MKYESYGTLFRTELTEGVKRDGQMEIPTIERTQAIPNRLISFDKAIAAKDTDQWVHFYIHDYMFERIWRNPFRYLPILMKFNGVLSPDFSIMWNYPLHTQLESTCKGRIIGAWLQQCGIPVIPNVRWGDSRTYDFAFDGIEPGGTVAVGTAGCMREKEARRVFTEGLSELVSRIHPSRIVVYGSFREDVFKVVRDAGIEIVHFPSATSVVMAAS